MYDINDKVYYTLYIYMYIPILFRLLDARTRADFSNYSHYRRWCSELLAYFGYFGANLVNLICAHFWRTFYRVWSTKIHKYQVWPGHNIGLGFEIVPSSVDIMTIFGMLFQSAKKSNETLVEYSENS